MAGSGPNWYARDGVKPEYEYSYGRQNWFPCADYEAKQLMTNCAFFDQSSFAKYSVEGRDALQGAEPHLAPPMSTWSRAASSTPSGCNERGGIEADLTVTRLAENRFLVVTGAAPQTRDMAWLKRHTPADAHCVATDITSGLPMIAVMGPKSRALLEKLSGADLSNAAFPFGTSRRSRSAMRGCGRAASPMWASWAGSSTSRPNSSPMCSRRCMAAGKEFGLTPAGMHTMNNCRTEKAYRHWGHDIADEDTPLEAGLGFAVAWDKPGGFIGREALLKQKALPVLPKRFVCLALEDNSDTAPMIYHEEPIYRNGVIVGSTTSGAWGHRVNLSLGLGYVHNKDGVTKDWIESGKWEVELAWKRYPAQVQLQAFYDPKGERIKA